MSNVLGLLTLLPQTSTRPVVVRVTFGPSAALVALPCGPHVGTVYAIVRFDIPEELRVLSPPGVFASADAPVLTHSA